MRLEERKGTGRAVRVKVSRDMTTTNRRGNSRAGKGEQKHISSNRCRASGGSNDTGDDNERPLDSQSDQKTLPTEKGRDTFKDANRKKFLYFMCNLIACEVEVELRDGRKFIGVFHTGVPLEGMSFDLILRLTRRSDGKS